MSLEFLNPAGLAALAALPLPILLHLARRTEQRVTLFAALAWIGRRQPPRQRIRLAEWLLLALRVALIAMIALWWAAPVWRGTESAASTMVLVAPGADLTKLTQPLPNGERHWLAPGFPAVDTPIPSVAAPTSSLLREFDAVLAPGATLVVVVPELVDGLDGGALQLHHAVQWVVVAARTLPSSPPSPMVTTTIALRHPDPDSEGNRVLRAAVAAWNVSEPGRYRLDEAALPVPPGAGATWLFAVDRSFDPTLRAFVEGGGTVLTIAAADSDAPVAWRGDGGRVLARERRVGRGRIVELAAPPTPSALPAVLDPGFPAALRQLLGDAPVAPSRAAAAAVAPTRVAGAGLTPAGRSLQHALALLLALLFLVERVLANGPRLRGAG